LHLTPHVSFLRHDGSPLVSPFVSLTWSSASSAGPKINFTLKGRTSHGKQNGAVVPFQRNTSGSLFCRNSHFFTLPEDPSLVIMYHWTSPDVGLRQITENASYQLVQIR